MHGPFPVEREKSLPNVAHRSGTSVQFRHPQRLAERLIAAPHQTDIASRLFAHIETICHIVTKISGSIAQVLIERAVSSERPPVAIELKKCGATIP